MAEGVAIFGEVLFDCFPDGSRVLGGAPFNVAWHLQAFAEAPLFVSRVGRDEPAAEIFQAMQQWGMSQQGLQIDGRHPTGTVAVSFVNGQPRYEILADQAYDFIQSGQLPVQRDFALLYHGTLALRHSISRQALLTFKSRHQGAVFVDVNLREPWWQGEDVLQGLTGVDWVKLNLEELDLLVPDSRPLAERMAFFMARFRLQGLIVTCGEQGALARLADGECLRVTPGQNIALMDCVGAGDAFAAVLMLGILRAWPMALIMERAQDFASALVGQRGATVSDQAFYRQFIEAWQLRGE